MRRKRVDSEGNELPVGIVETNRRQRYKRKDGTVGECVSRGYQVPAAEANRLSGASKPPAVVARNPLKPLALRRSFR